MLQDSGVEMTASLPHVSNIAVAALKFINKRENNCRSRRFKSSIPCCSFSVHRCAGRTLWPRLCLYFLHDFPFVPARPNILQEDLGLLLLLIGLLFLSKVLKHWNSLSWLYPTQRFDRAFRRGVSGLSACYHVASTLPFILPIPFLLKGTKKLSNTVKSGKPETLRPWEEGI